MSQDTTAGQYDAGDTDYDGAVPFGTQLDAPAPVRQRALRYLGDEGAMSRYGLWIEGREVLRIVVDSADPELMIRVAQPMGGAKLHDTRGRAQMRAYGHDAPGTVTHVDPNSIRSYLRGRVATLLARVYVPTAADAPAEPTDLFGDPLAAV